MSKETFERLKEGLEDAIAYMEGDKSRGRVHTVMVPVVDVRAVRKKLGMSQDVFARRFGVSAATVRNWEQGRRRPDGPARVLLQVIDKEPEAVKRALAG
ncbi:MAG: helix-turn-helix domain-containing protein [Alphaproteobacteria bacterium]|nr:helix-turn-helix domain-containing protein [Alphaproteobacteria bacterium]